MALPDELISQLVKITNDRKESGDDNKVVYGTIIDSGTRHFVRVDGSTELTPVDTTATIKPGDRVIVSIRNHTALVTGNVDDPSASSIDLKGVITLLEGDGEVEGLVVQIRNMNVTITEQGVSIKGLSDGTTTIDGGCIKTGTIDAERINLTGAISWNDLSTSMQSDLGDIEDAADEALTLVNGFTITSGSKTYIDGSMIYSESIYADALHLGGEMTVYKTLTGNTVGGYIGWCTGWNSTKGIAIMHSASEGQCVCTDAGARLSFGGDSQVVASPKGVTADGAQWFIVEIGGYGVGRFDDSAFHGYSSISLGSASYPWPEVFAETAEAETSDRNKKNSIEDLPEKYIKLFDKLSPRRYKLNNGKSDRYHVGYIAQEVEEAMSEVEIDSKEFGGFIRDYEKDEDGNPTGNEILMLRYGEFDAIYAAKIKQLETRLNEMENFYENKIKQLEERLAALEA